MPLNFPTSPSTNDEYSFGGKTWVYNGAGWNLKTVQLTTANVNESGNLYYTDARVYSNVILIGYAANSYVNSQLSLKANIADLTTANVAEQSNLYFTNVRVSTAVSTQTLSNATFTGNVQAGGFKDSLGRVLVIQDQGGNIIWGG